MVELCYLPPTQSAKEGPPQELSLCNIGSNSDQGGNVNIVVLGHPPPLPCQGHKGLLGLTLSLLCRTQQPINCHLKILQLKRSNWINKVTSS